MLSLIVVAGLMAAGGAVASIASPGMVGPIGTAQVSFLGTFIFGALPVALYGAPVYVWLSRTSRANWRSVSLVGLVPSLLLLLVHVELGALALLCAPTVACLTHFVCRKWVSPNNSFKPMPLRGTA